METDNMITKSHPNTTHRLLPAVLPVLFIAITYVDPGKWVAAIEGGARFGYDLILLMFVFSLAAVLCQYLSASIAVVTGKDLAQICSTEYDTITCVFLGIQAELSMIALDLTMQDQGLTQISKGALCHDHLFAISCVFSGIFIINCFLMNSAANVFYSTGLDLLTFQDALSLMDQVFRSLMAPFALVIVLVLSYHTTAFTWKFSGQSVLLNFFKIDIPGWCHHSTIRFIALIPALQSIWHLGAEGAYQLMLFTQVMVAILLTSSVIILTSTSELLKVSNPARKYKMWLLYHERDRSGRIWNIR